MLSSEESAGSGGEVQGERTALRCPGPLLWAWSCCPCWPQRCGWAPASPPAPWAMALCSPCSPSAPCSGLWGQDHLGPCLCEAWCGALLASMANGSWWFGQRNCCCRWFLWLYRNPLQQHSAGLAEADVQPPPNWDAGHGGGRGDPRQQGHWSGGCIVHPGQLWGWRCCCAVPALPWPAGPWGAGECGSDPGLRGHGTPWHTGTGSWEQAERRGELGACCPCPCRRAPRVSLQAVPGSVLPRPGSPSLRQGLQRMVLRGAVFSETAGDVVCVKLALPC